MSEAAAKKIDGSTYETMPELGHFPMCEDPERFFRVLRPVLDRVLEGGAG